MYINIANKSYTARRNLKDGLVKLGTLTCRTANKTVNMAYRVGETG